MNDADLETIINRYQSRIQRDGFMGLDFNMCAICIASRRLGRTVEFSKPGNESEKMAYWAGKRSFGERRFSGEDEILEAALAHQ